MLTMLTLAVSAVAGDTEAIQATTAISAPRRVPEAPEPVLIARCYGRTRTLLRSSVAALASIDRSVQLVSRFVPHPIGRHGRGVTQNVTVTVFEQAPPSVSHAW